MHPTNTLFPGELKQSCFRRQRTLGGPGAVTRAGIRRGYWQLPAQGSSLQHCTFAELHRKHTRGQMLPTPGKGVMAMQQEPQLPTVQTSPRRGTSLCGNPGEGLPAQGGLCRDQGTDPPATADAAMEPIGLENQRNSSHVWPSMLFSSPSSVVPTRNPGVDLDASLSPNPSTSIIEHRHFYLLRISAISYLHSQSHSLWSIYFSLSFAHNASRHPSFLTYYVYCLSPHSLKRQLYEDRVLCLFGSLKSTWHIVGIQKIFMD